MKSVAGPLVAAIVLAVAGGGFWLVGQTETRIADVHKQLAMLQYAEADSEGDAVEQSLGLERRVPVVGKAAETDVRDTRAAAGYWRADYAAIAPQQRRQRRRSPKPIPRSCCSPPTPASAPARRRPIALDTVRRLDGVVKSYAEVLKTEPAVQRRRPACETRAMDAAFNYEFTIRARDALAQRRGPAAGKARRAQGGAEDGDESDLPAGPTLHGQPGGPPPATEMNQFKIVIPKRGDERKDAPDAGKGGQKIRKG